jgi:rubrerythrin
MYNERDLIRVLRKNLDTEIRVITLYLDNASKLNYEKNKAKVDLLIFDSFHHATWLAKEICVLNKGMKGILDRKVQDVAYREESGVKELYLYEAQRTKDAAAKKLLLKLVREEARHERIVKSFK